MKLKKQTRVEWTDRNGMTRKGIVVSFVPKGSDATDKLPKKVLSLPSQRRKIEPIAKFDRYLIAEQRKDGDWIYSRRESELIAV